MMIGGYGHKVTPILIPFGNAVPYFDEVSAEDLMRTYIYPYFLNDFDETVINDDKEFILNWLTAKGAKIYKSVSTKTRCVIIQGMLEYDRYSEYRKSGKKIYSSKDVIEYIKLLDSYEQSKEESIKAGKVNTTRPPGYKKRKAPVISKINTIRPLGYKKRTSQPAAVNNKPFRATGKRDEKGSNGYDILKDYTVIDLETNSNHVNNCEIIEVAAVRIRNGQVTNVFQSLVKPSSSIDTFIEILTGITNDMLKDAPTAEEIIPQYADFIGNDIVVGHNISTFDTCIIYDYFMKILNKPFRNDMVDTLWFSKRCRIQPDDYKLKSIAKYFGIQYDAHRALNDCLANHECYERMKPLLDFSSISDNSSSSSKKFKGTVLSEKTKALSELSQIIRMIVDNNKLTDNEILGLMKWVIENNYLAGNYPFDDVFKIVNNIIANGFDESKRKELLAMLSEHADPISSRADDSEVDFSGKVVCLTGDFVNGTKNEIALKFESAGAIIQKHVTLKIDFLIVGGNGSADWSCGNYGNKVKKALELQNSGNEIKIIREDVALRCLNSKKLLTV